MDAYQQINSEYWTLPDSFSTDFPRLPQDDFLSMLQKEFPDSRRNVNPHPLTPFTTATSLSPPSDYSTPSPPNIAHEQNPRGRLDHDESDPALKRKASQEEIPGIPSSKTQHTSDASPARKTAPRRKATAQDESRLLKRKEQNRAAQRAFRERKEKHVKDLEDQVAALQAQHEEALSENDQLRELLSKLQNENAALQRAPFTFAVSKNAASEQGSSTQLQAPEPITDATASSLSFPLSLQDGEIDWSALHVIDPPFVDMLDDHPQMTATDFGFDYPSAPTTIASNPQYMSLADTFGAPTNSGVGSPSTNGDPFAFDIGYIPSWTEFPLPESSPDHDPLQELLGGTLSSTQSPSDVNVYTMTSSDSPVQHTAIPSISTPALTSSTTTPSNASLFNTPRESTTTIPEELEEIECPKTKEELRRKIAEAGSSTFVEKPLVPMVRRKLDPQSGLPSVGCDGAKLPLTKQSENNVEVMAAWKRITSHPNFKEADITELCTAFSEKARCDGEKVVLEPQGVKHIIDTLRKKRNPSLPPPAT